MDACETTPYSADCGSLKLVCDLEMLNRDLNPYHTTCTLPKSNNNKMMTLLMFSLVKFTY